MSYISWLTTRPPHPPRPAAPSGVSVRISFPLFQTGCVAPYWCPRCSLAASLLQTPEFEVEFFSHRYVCFLCWELPRACIFLDCCHVVTCSRCCYQTSVCPICYHRVSGRILIVNW